METAVFIGAIIGAYIAIIGCYLFTFSLWGSVNARVDLLLANLTKQLADTMAIINLKLDKVITDVATIKGEHEEQNRSKL